ncbi:TPA: YcxB family protein [Candidatus Scatousia excrementigallinarum]|uniref:YcxB family protein n=1 Tax=Candidatus Scatousia excrementigallinarum TaxID=2840935 RepID=A0A9D1EX73_9BACT|nr:YcxB family protein [Candidatus Scatousia excrementigallinarum]
MEKIKYTLTLDDCRDYVKYQRKIPRLKKYVFKQFMPLIILFVLIILFSLAMEISFFFKAFHYVSGEYAMSFSELLKTDFSALLLEGIADHFWNMNLPILLIWAVIFCTAWFISKNDIFHAESSKIYKGLKNQSLDIEITPQEDGLYCKGKNVSALYKWKDILDIYDTKKSYLAYVGESSALIIPKRAFPQQEESESFYNYVNDKLNSK